MRTHLSRALLALWLFGADLSAAEINGKVRESKAGAATVRVEGALAPRIGDRAEIFFKMPGLDEEISVATGHVLRIEADAIELEIENATGEVAKDQLVRIKSEKPQPKPTVQASPPAEPPLPPSPTPQGLTIQRPSQLEQMASKTLTFEEIPIGPLAADVFIQHGIRFAPGKGKPEVFEVQPNMLLPLPCQKVMLVGGDRVTSLGVLFDPPVKRFALYRVGTAGGASTPTWTMTAYNDKNSIDTTGEDRGLPPQAKFFTVEGKRITRVEIRTDNRYGTGTWATWNSLPIAAFGYDR